MTKNEVITFLRNKKSYLQDNYGVLKIGLFGSYAREEQKDSSDIDILVDMPSSFKKFYDLKYFLEKEFQKNVDLGTVNNLRAFIGNRIEKDIIYV